MGLEDLMPKINLLTEIMDMIDEIPNPPPGRNMALVKTKLEEAKLWLVEELSKDEESIILLSEVQLARVKKKNK